jgi:hypothetical protein
MTDDLTVIDGIGEKRAEMLADELDVHTYADLAALDPDDVVAAFAARGRRVRTKAVALWIADAAQRVPVLADGWTIVSLFLVSFERREGEARTSAHRVGSDDEQQWPGHAAAAVGEWMAAGIARVDGASDAQEDPDAEEAPPTDAGPGHGAAPPPAPELPPEPELVTAFRVLQPPDAVHPCAMGDDDNLAVPLDEGVALAVELEATAAGAFGRLQVRARLIGAQPPFATPWRPARPWRGPEVVRGVIGGVEAGLYRLQVRAVSDDDGDDAPVQNGPLFLVE